MDRPSAFDSESAEKLQLVSIAATAIEQSNINRRLKNGLLCFVDRPSDRNMPPSGSTRSAFTPLHRSANLRSIRSGQSAFAGWSFLCNAIYEAVPGGTGGVRGTGKLWDR